MKDRPLQRYEYKAIPAPERAEKVKGLKRTGERFAHGVTAVMNEMAAAGWEYMRAETLPCEESKGFLRGSTTSQQSVLVFRRELPGVRDDRQPAARAPEQDAHAPAAQPVAPAVDSPAESPRTPASASEPPLQGQASARPNGPDATTREPVLRADKSDVPETTRRLSLSLDEDGATGSGAAPLTATRKPDGES